MKKKKLYSSEEKAIIIREHLENKVSISELSEKYEIHPNLLYKWQKQLFEQAPQSLSRKTNKDQRIATKASRRIEELEALLQRRENLITELVQENIDLKKNLTGEVLTRNGLNRKSGTK